MSADVACVDFLIADLTPLEKGAMQSCQVQVWSTGQTLEAWVVALRKAGAADVVAVEHRPGAPMPASWKALVGGKSSPARDGVVRVFAFGMEKARAKVRAAIRDWDVELDWFVG